MHHPCVLAVLVVPAVLATSTLVVPTYAVGQQPATTAPVDSASPYRYDLGRYLFATPRAEVAERAHLASRFKELEAQSVHAPESAALLYRALVLADSVVVEARRHLFYLYVRMSVNTLDAASAEARSAIDARLEAAKNHLKAQLQRVDTVRLNRFIAQRPALEVYRFAVTSARRYAAHTPSVEQQSVLTTLTPLASGWQQPLYHRLITRTPFGIVQTARGPMDAYRQAGAIANDPDSAVREIGYRLLWAGYNSQRDLYAVALLATVRTANALARERHFDDAPAEAYFRAYVTPAEVRELIDRVRQRAMLWKRFERVVAAHSRWVRAQQVANTNPRARLSLDSASRLIEAAVAPLGPLYYGEMAALLDPANARLEVAGGPNRAAGGSSIGGGAAESGLYLHGFEGFYRDMESLAHEAGHAVENQFLFEEKVPAVYASHDPSYLAESYALFNELLLADTLFRGSTTDAARQFYLAQFLSIAMEVFHGAQDADLEQSVYDGVSSGHVTTPDQLDSLTRRVDESYTITGETRPEVRARWITARIMYDDPMYLFNYMYSGILALKFFGQYSLDRAHFAARYVSLLRTGYRAPPIQTLRQSLGIDLSNPKLLDDGIALLESRLNTLESLYAKQEARGSAGKP